jgi:methylated-DNA-[protein]-cysteine S-methyltransferase
MDSPIGALTLVADGERLACVYMTEHAPDSEEFGPRADDGLLGEAARQLEEYFDGERTAFDLPLVDDVGTPFQRRVWAELLAVGFGRTATYGEIAHRLGMTNAASRAVGLANGRNPISIVVPCHRVIGSSGALTGYGGGIERKRWLLRHEGAAFRERPVPHAA